MRARLQAPLLALLALAGACLPAEVRDEPDGPVPIPQAQYPGPDASAEDMFAFFKSATAEDDPVAAYFCFHDLVKADMSQSIFFEGWTAYGRYIPLFAEAELVDARDEPPMRAAGKTYAARVLQVDLEGVEEAFLWLKQPEGWRLVLPSPYSERSLEQLFELIVERSAHRLDRRIRPARRGG